MHYVLIKCTGKRKKVLENAIESTWFGANFGTNKCSNLNWFMYVTVPFFFLWAPLSLDRKANVPSLLFFCHFRRVLRTNIHTQCFIQYFGRSCVITPYFGFPQLHKSSQKYVWSSVFIFGHWRWSLFFLSFEQYCDIHPRCLVGFCVASMLSIFLILCYRKVKF